MAGSQGVSASSATGGFEEGWYATDLGDHRPGDHTYDHYAHDSLPPLDPSRYTGAFDWLGGLTDGEGETGGGGAVPGQAAPLGAAAEALAAHGLALPGDFTAFQLSAHRFVLDEVSVTACWTSISEPLPSPVEPGAFLVRFLRDQQDCLFWYLYLRPSGDTFVVVSPVDYAYEYETQALPGDEPVDVEAHRAEIRWCAPSFEAFAHRYWLENRLWHVLNGTGGDDSIADPQLRAYAAHYIPSALTD